VGCVKGGAWDVEVRGRTRSGISSGSDEVQVLDVGGGGCGGGKVC
jgi:hypothetical protein